ncbi:metal ABC transporter solute-binding protein, Zn/Mn family, partial [Brachyspira hampsonii]
VSSNKLKVYASIYPIYDFAKKICGDKADVYNMTSAGSEPHDFEITSKDMADLTKADLFIYNGGGMEHWADTVKDSIKELKYIETSSNISNEGLDPHFWLSPIKAKKQMENIKNALADIDSVNADYYNSNYNFYANKLDELDNHFKEVLSNIKNTNLVVTHPAFGHFCKEYLLNQVAIARDEADPKAMSETIDFIKNNNVKAIFYEEFSSSKLVDSIAKETGVKTLTLNPIESLSEEYIKAGKDYFSVMEENLASLTNGLN